MRLVLHYIFYVYKAPYNIKKKNCDTKLKVLLLYNNIGKSSAL